MTKNIRKEELIRSMHVLGFDWICDVAFEGGVEFVGSYRNDEDSVWWRQLEVEGSGFTRLFKGSIESIG